jgi:hypothetical protein
VVVEDSPTGVRAGVAAGMTVLGYSKLMPATRLRAAGAHHCFDDMAALPQLIAQGRRPEPVSPAQIAHSHGSRVNTPSPEPAWTTRMRLGTQRGYRRPRPRPSRQRRPLDPRRPSSPARTKAACDCAQAGPVSDRCLCRTWGVISMRGRLDVAHVPRAADRAKRAPGIPLRIDALVGVLRRVRKEWQPIETRSANSPMSRNPGGRRWSRTTYR